MESINLRLPDSLHEQVRKSAERDGVSINPFATLAITEKIFALMTSDYLEERAQRGDRTKFEHALAKVNASAEPAPQDRLPE
jgi:hypothetical protein